MSVAETFAARLVAYRTDKATTQAALAAACGLSQGALSHIETGRREPTLTNAVAIAAALGFSLDDLTPTNED